MCARSRLNDRSLPMPAVFAVASQEPDTIQKTRQSVLDCARAADSVLLRRPSMCGPDRSHLSP